MTPLTDITYLPTTAGWFYLVVVVVDLFSRKVVGWSRSTSLATELVCEAPRHRISTPPGTPAPAPIGSRLSVYERCLSADAPPIGHRMLDDPYRLLLRQRGDGRPVRPFPIGCRSDETSGCRRELVVTFLSPLPPKVGRERGQEQTTTNGTHLRMQTLCVSRLRKRRHGKLC